MGEQVFWASGIIVVAAEAHVALFVNIDSQGVPGRDYNPHSEVKLPVHDQHRVLYVLLDDPSRLGACARVLAYDWFQMIHVVLGVARA